MIVRFEFINYMHNGNIPSNYKDLVVGFLHNCLGENNPYHGSFSDYCVSEIYDGKKNIVPKIDKDSKTLTFSEYPVLYISSENENLINALIMGSIMNKSKLFGSVPIIGYEDFDVKSPFVDTIDLKCVLLKDKQDDIITVGSDPERWISVMEDKCRAKLKYEGIEDPNFKLEYKFKGRDRNIYYKHIKNRCSVVKLKVYGDIQTRKTLYNMGFGNSTGCGFGFVNLYTV